MSKIKCALLVDDDSINNFVNQTLIAKLNITGNVITALNGEEALKHVRQYCSVSDRCCPDLILLDINMPVMDGFDFLEEYSKLDFSNKNQVVIIVLTTSSNPKDIEKIEQYKVNGFINKPLTEEKLRNILQIHFPDSSLPE